MLQIWKERIFVVENFMHSGGKSNTATYRGTVYNTATNLNPQEFCDFRGEAASQSGGVSQTGPRQEDSGQENEGYDWSERRAMGTSRQMGKQITSSGSGE